jgi:hypothetical protein
MTYRYDHFRPVVMLDELRAMRRPLRPGTKLPRFELPTADGGLFDSADHLGRPILIVLASYT